MDYESAILEFERVIRKYPSHNDLDYVYYMKAICNYEQITHEGLDGTYNEPFQKLSTGNKEISR